MRDDRGTNFLGRLFVASALSLMAASVLLPLFLGRSWEPLGDRLFEIAWFWEPALILAVLVVRLFRRKESGRWDRLFQPKDTASGRR